MQERMPKSWRAFQPDESAPDLNETCIPGNQPGLRLVRPGFVGVRRCEYHHRVDNCEEKAHGNEPSLNRMVRSPSLNAAGSRRNLCFRLHRYFRKLIRFTTTPSCLASPFEECMYLSSEKVTGSTLVQESASSGISTVNSCAPALSYVAFPN